MHSESYHSLLKAGASVLLQAGVPDAEFDARCLLQKASGLDGTHLRMQYDTLPCDAIAQEYHSYIARRVQGEPLQYILGEWDFYGHTFSVRPRVLIPRPETEYLAHTAIRSLPPNGILFDVCAGTGCIGLSAAAERQDAHVFLVDKYDDPVALCRKNADQIGVRNVTVLQHDLFRGFPHGLPAPDVIVSNPPYIPAAEMDTLQREVQHEPREALDGGADGLMFYRALRAQWYPALREGGVLSMECGEGQPEQVAALFPQGGEIAPDYLGVPRFVTVKSSGKGLLNLCCCG